MRSIFKYIFQIFLAGLLWAVIWSSNASVNSGIKSALVAITPPDSTNSDTSNLKYPFNDFDDFPYSNSDHNSGLYMHQPSNIKTDVEYDSESGEYIFKQKMGNIDYRYPNTMTLEEYQKWDFDNAMRKYWQQRQKTESFERQSTLIPKINIGGEVFDRVFGSNTIDIKPQGSAELIFGIKINKIDNPNLPVKMRRNTTFDFQEKIQMNVTGQIGDKMKLSTNYNTEATFDFENKMNLAYDGKEDEIIKKIEAGNVNLPLTGTLISGSQSLFGLKTELQFGRLTATSVFSQQKGKTQVIEVQGGAQTNTFEVTGDSYEANRHFFLSQYFYDHYEEALSTLPIINSGINITKVEVWITNKVGNYEESRNIVAFLDLAEQGGNIYNQAIQSENTSYPQNSLNTLYPTLTSSENEGVRNINSVISTLTSIPLLNLISGRDYEKIENARKLSASEYTINSKLGYISLNSALNADEVLAVAFEYTVNGKTYQVGEFSNGGIAAPKALLLKLLKGTSFTPKYPNWRLMMKNIYSIGAYQVKSDGFELQVMYQNDKTGKAINYIPEGNLNKEILLKVLNLDNLNQQLDPSPDGVFDFIDKYTINASNGRVIFPVLEPFGKFLAQKIDDPVIASKYVYQELYDSTQYIAKQIASKNKFFLQGKYQSSSSSEISLNAMNIPQGSVVVTAGGMKLNENVDYTVDYTLGKVKIINQGILESGTPIKISLESNSLMSMQSKTLLGTHLDYKVNKNFMLGGTILNLTERPLTQKVNIGDEPISNTIWGIDGTYKSDVPFLTKMVDWLPFIETKEMSTVTITGEFAHLIPGHSKAVDKQGIAYIDDFEGTKTSIDIRSYQGWVLASTPQKQNDLFPEANFIDSIGYGFNRAKLAWYSIDPIFLRNNSQTPNYLVDNPNLQSSHFVREVFEKEIFPYKDPPNNIPQNITVLNLGYYPEEKGPYNFDIMPTSFSSGIDQNGKLLNPKSRWGGIMRRIETNDFEAANIEYIEFWLMDPFVEDSLTEGGDFYINLGEVSEDILKDSRKAFESGLPTSVEVKNVDTTIWGRVPLTQSLVLAFDNNESSRPFQDVGFDGLRDADESLFFSKTTGRHAYLDSIAAMFGMQSVAYQNALKDPSNDDFHYYRGSDYDQEELGILERYKKFNNSEGNSPASSQSTEQYQTTGSIQPDIEDINRDNTLNETENYFQYKIHLTPEDMKVGQNFITDKVDYTATFANDVESKVSWYQFKVPIADYEKVVGTISDFKSIRFIRMFLKDFEKPIVLRFATLDLVRGEWRKYLLPLNEGVVGTVTSQTEPATFDISAVNIEENGNRTPVNYILPPGINRVIDPTNPQLRQLNEQSIVLKVSDLADGDARAAYKTANLDIRQYKRLQMFVHAESVENNLLNDFDICAFIRIGSDYTNNYYEYEVPLVVTPSGQYDLGGETEPDRYIVWPGINNIDLPLDTLLKVKYKRDDAMRVDGSEITLNTLYKVPYGKNYMYITGNPNLSNIKTIMIGIRNKSKYNNSLPDDGLPKCVEVWMNELRMTEFNEKGGWAANARMTAKLADFATVTVAGNTSKPGFGSIEKKVNERNKEDIYQYDVSSNMELGKFFPEKAKISVPMYVGYSEGFVNPQYYPLNPDVPLKVALENARDKTERDSIRYTSQDYTRRKSLNFTNVRVNQTSSKPKIWDPGNIALNYSFSEVFVRNINTSYNTLKNYRGGLSYNYSTTPKEIMPFKNAKWLKSNSLKIIKDFNFNYVPTQLSVRLDLNRQYNEIQLRNLSNPDIIISPTFNKNFLEGRYYDFKHNITKNLKLDYTATNMSRIDEPDGRVDRNDSLYSEWKNTVWDNIKNFRRTTQFNHTLNLNYTLPINKIPLFNWVTVSARYSATYNWTAGPITNDTINLGNTIKNTNTSQLNGQLNLINLYNKVKYLNKLTQNSKKPKSNKEKKTEKVTWEKEGLILKANTPRILNHKLGTEDVTVKAFDKAGKEIKGKSEVINENKVSFTVTQDYQDVKVIVTGTKEAKNSILKIAMDQTLLFLMGVKNVNLSYAINNGTLLPGYMPKTVLFGMDSVFESNSWAPGLPFILGWQDRDFVLKAAGKGWLSKDPKLNSAYAMTENETWNFRSSVEPLKGMRIDITANNSLTKSISEYYIYNDTIGEFQIRNQMITGNFNMSVITWGSAFEKINSLTSAAFETFKSNRIIIAQRLAEERAKVNDAGYSYNPNILDEKGFPDGYSQTSQEVLIPAFLAAYTGKDAKKVSLDALPNALHMMPNWRITYDGLSKIKFLKKYIKTANLSHQYRSTYSITSFATNMLWEPQQSGFSYVRDLQNNFISNYDINSVSISEQFSPLFGLDLTWNNSLSTKIEVKKNRTLSMAFSNNQLTEMKTNEYVVGAGYRIKDVKVNITSGGNKKQYKSDLNLRADLSIRNNITVLRKMVEEIDESTAGQLNYTLKLSADYVLSDRFNLKLFFDRIMNKPIVPTTFRNANTSFGVSVKFTLTQ